MILSNFFNDKSNHQNMRWDNKSDVYGDYIYLDRVYEKLLEALSSKMNSIHGVDFSIRYWRILFGHWLRFYAEKLFFEWYVSDRKLGYFSHHGIEGKVFEKSYLAEQDTLSSMDKIVKDGSYQKSFEYIAYCKKNRLPLPVVNYSSEDLATESNVNNSFLWRGNLTISWLNKFVTDLIRRFQNNRHRIIKSCISSLLELILSACSKIIPGDQYFIYTRQLNIFERIKLQILLMQFPRVFKEISSQKVPYDILMRDWTFSDEEANWPEKDDFESSLLDLLPLFIPRVFLEGYRATNHLPRKNRWPKSVKLIFTTQSQFYDESFKFWAAYHQEGGAKLLIAQHGGGYGMTPHRFVDDHEMKISDFFLTWGWRVSDHQNVIDFGCILDDRHTNITPLSMGGLLLVLPPVTRSVNRCGFGPVTPKQRLHYFSSILFFASHLPGHISQNTTVRFHSKTDFSYLQKFRTVPKLKLDVYPVGGIALALSRSRLCVSTYNSTVYLESLSLNFPTVIFWDPSYNELNDQARALFVGLKRVGIYHESAKSALKHVQNVWDNVELWWSKSETQTEVKRFCHKYVRRTHHPVYKELASLFKGLVV